MFERLQARVEAKAERKAHERAAALAEEMDRVLPGVAAEARKGAVILSGRGLRRRLALDPRLLWSVWRQG